MEKSKRQTYVKIKKYVEQDENPTIDNLQNIIGKINMIAISYSDLRFIIKPILEKIETTNMKNDKPPVITHNPVPELRRMRTHDFEAKPPKRLRSKTTL